MILGVDVGRKVVGVALGDPLTGVVTPKGSYSRAKGNAEGEILKLIEEWGCSIVVVGIPLNAAGEKTEQCLDAEKFGRRLSKRAEVRIEYVDEFLSSAEAADRLSHLDESVKGLKQRGVLDATAASIILENYFRTIRAQ